VAVVGFVFIEELNLIWIKSLPFSYWLVTRFPFHLEQIHIFTYFDGFDEVFNLTFGETKVVVLSDLHINFYTLWSQNTKHLVNEAISCSSSNLLLCSLLHSIFCWS